jgi:hypothetical protein
MDLVGDDDLQNEKDMREMWKDSMKSVNCTQGRITYDNFVLLMKGQTKEPEPERLHTPIRQSGLGPNLVAVPEGVSMEDLEHEDVETTESQLTPTVGAFKGDGLLHGKSDDEISVHSLPNLGAKDFSESSNGSSGMIAGHETSSPAIHKIITEVPPAEPDTPGLSIDEDEAPITPSSLGRPRSYSLTDKAESTTPKDENGLARFKSDSRRAIALPEHENNLHDSMSKKSALIVNRQLYRAHRQMRLAVMEASRRFEEQQTRRARDTLIAQKAGLVMRHGRREQVTTEAIRRYLEESKAEQQVLVEKANRRGGRGRASRKKTISDMSGMLVGSMGQDELGDIAAKACKTPDHQKSLFNSSMNKLDMPSLAEGNLSLPGLQPRPSNIPRPAPVVDVVDLPVVDVVEAVVRGATVPGKFIATEDPFGTDGMYGGSRINSELVNEIKSKRAAKLNPRKPM